MDVSIDTVSIEEYGRMLIQEINQLLIQGIILPLYSEREKYRNEADYIKEISHIKRFLEQWSADSELRAQLENPTGLNEEVEDLRSLWDEDAPRLMPSLRVLKYRAFNYEKITHRNILRANCASSLPSYNQWKTRQMNRCHMELRPLTAYSIVHAPFCIELCQGCSVGCWFCGISAPKLDDIFFYTEENARLYNHVLNKMKAVYGEAAGKGFCYWATDPMDNPDYEKFMYDFYICTGVFPQTTTALALKDINRTRKLLELSRQCGGRLERFSLLSYKQLQMVHQEFTPEELLYVELVTQNRESFGAKAKSGRAVEGGLKRESSESNRTGDQVTEGTIACVSGFLISMVKKQVKLISPCEANPAWPLGYIVFEEGYFDDPDSFDQLIDGMIQRHWHTALQNKQVLRFADHLEYGPLENGFSVSSKYMRKTFNSFPVFAAIGERLQKGCYTAEEVLDSLEVQYGHSRAELLYFLTQIYDQGLLREPC